VGEFTMSTLGSGKVTVVGQYITTWTVPALMFSTTSTGNVTMPGNTNG
jgi:hypothetical protein